jgi:hypothetical protein
MLLFLLFPSRFVGAPDRITVPSTLNGDRARLKIDIDALTGMLWIQVYSSY